MRPILIDSDAFICLRHLKLAAGLECWDVITLIMEAVEAGILTLEEARIACAPWEDKRNQAGRPRDFSTFDEAWRRRRMQQTVR